MRAHEILTEYEFPEIEVRKPRKKPVDIFDYDGEARKDRAAASFGREREEEVPNKNPKVKTLGSGTFASAYVNQDTPQDVTKGSQLTKEPDGFRAFFTALSKDEEAQANPYFPRFRQIRTYSNKHEGDKKRTSYVVRVEKLEPFTNLSRAERNMLIDKIFTEKGIVSNFADESGLGVAIYSASIDRKHITGIEIKDPDFLDALWFLDEVAENYGYGLDLHDENIMVRRTSVGPQIVLNDPLGFSNNKLKRLNQQ